MHHEITVFSCAKSQKWANKKSVFTRSPPKKEAQHEAIEKKIQRESKVASLLFILLIAIFELEFLWSQESSA